MKFKLHFFFFSLLFSVQTMAQFQAVPLGNWRDNGLVVNPSFNSRYNDVWGWANDSGQEFAFIGSTEAIHIIDVTEPTNLTEVGRIAGADAGFFLVHRDLKVFKDHLYCVADEGGKSSLQIIDLSGLPDTAIQVYNSNEFVTTAHNIFIDSAQARLYLLGRSGSTAVLDVSVPAAPALLAIYPIAGFPLPYVHDAYVVNNIGYMNCAADGLWVVDFTDPAEPIILGTIEDYPNAGYNHSGWMAEDGAHYFMCDETHGSPMKVVDLSDPGDMTIATNFELGRWGNEIPHNVAVKEGLLYVSHYYDGLQVFDVSNPVNPIRIAEFDTYPDANEAWYAGNWGVYPYLPSGNILLSDMQYGLYVVEKLPEKVTQYLDLKENEFEICEGDELAFEMTIGSGFSDLGVLLSATLPTGAAIEFVPSATAQPGDVVAVFINGLSSTSGVSEEFVLHAGDGTDSLSAFFYVVVQNAQMPVTNINSPDQNEVVPHDDIFFAWTANGASSYILQIATDENEFDNSIVYSHKTIQFFHPLDTVLAMGEQYFWRVIAIGDCGEAVSGTWAFSTEPSNSTEEIVNPKINVYPNPADDFLLVHFEKGATLEMEVNLYTVTGLRVVNQHVPVGRSNIRMEVEGLLAGVYFLEVRNSDRVQVKRVVVK